MSFVCKVAVGRSVVVIGRVFILVCVFCRRGLIRIRVTAGGFLFSSCVFFFEKVVLGVTSW